jgi:hypothetical protein
MGRQIEQAAGERFIELYGHLLAHVNTEHDIVNGIETYDDLHEREDAELRPIRNCLYKEDTEQLIADFVAENPADIPDDELETVEQWTDYAFGEFVVVRHLEEYAVFLDWEEPPQAFGVKAASTPFSAHWEEKALPLLLSRTALLPFEGKIIIDGWLAIQPIVFGGSISTDIDDAYEEAKHRFGIIETLPAPDEEAETSDTEQLRFYMKNKRNRERYANEIETLKHKNPELERIYHEELGKARARSLGRELRDLNLNEAYFAIYDERIIASGISEEQVQQILDKIMPAGKENHPYIYHFNP